MKQLHSSIRTWCNIEKLEVATLVEFSHLEAAIQQDTVDLLRHVSHTASKSKAARKERSEFGEFTYNFALNSRINGSGQQHCQYGTQTQAFHRVQNPQQLSPVTTVM